MRVIAGKLGGRTIKSPDGHRTHPMSDKVRGALFNALDDIQGLTVFDAFAGSGAVSIESISRGARHATALEIDKRAYDTICENIHSLELEDQIKVIRANASTWSDLNINMQFDIVILDPPYDSINQKLLDKLVLHTQKDGVVVFSHPPSSNTVFEGFNVISAKSYGDAELTIYRRN